jgi:prefoldin subunit 1
MKRLRNGVQMREHERTRAKLTMQELEHVTEESASASAQRLFKPLGRSFVLESKETLVKGLEEASKRAGEEIEKAMNQREYLAKQLQDVEMNLRELMQGNDALAAELKEHGVI